MFGHHSRDILPKSPLTTGYEDEYRVYTCDYCMKPTQYYSETEVEDHKKHRHALTLKEIARDPLGCMTCFEIAPNKDLLVKHTKTVHLFIPETANKLEHPAYICYYCENLFFNKLLLEAHIKKYHMKCHGEMRWVTCPLCKFKTRNVCGHFRSHHFPSLSICQICARKCKDREALKEHVKTHPRQYCCEACAFETNKREFYENHLLRHPTKTTTMKIRYKKYFAKKYRRTHLSHIIIGANVGKVVKICILCRYICVAKDDMKKHIFSMHMSDEKLNNEVKKPMCSCGEEFLNKILLKQHIFRLKGDHRPVSENMSPVIKIEKDVYYNNNTENGNDNSFHSVPLQFEGYMGINNKLMDRDSVIEKSGVLQEEGAVVKIEIKDEPNESIGNGNDNSFHSVPLKFEGYIGINNKLVDRDSAIEKSGVLQEGEAVKIEIDEPNDSTENGNDNSFQSVPLKFEGYIGINNKLVDGDSAIETSGVLQEEGAAVKIEIKDEPNESTENGNDNSFHSVPLKFEEYIGINNKLVDRDSVIE